MGRESFQHELLKEIAVIWLKSKGCREIAMEVHVQGAVSTANTPTARMLAKDHADIVGAKRTYDHRTRERTWEFWCVEVKVSRSDLGVGFIKNGCHKHYLFTLPMMIQSSEIPIYVGILELNPDSPEVWRFVRKSIYPRLEVPAVKIRRAAIGQEMNANLIPAHLESIKQAYNRTLTSVIMSKYKSQNMVPYSVSRNV